jgi:potassium efflux system protein
MKFRLLPAPKFHTPVWARVLLVCALSALLCAHTAQAAPPPQAAAQAATAKSDGTSTPLPSVEGLRSQLDAIPQQLGESDDGRKRLSEVNAIGAAAERLATARAGELADLDLRLAGLGPAPERGAPADTADVAEQRTALAQQRAAIDSELKLARLITVDAEQRGTELIRQRRAQFQQALTAHTDSVLTPGFWHSLAASLPGDRARLHALWRDLRDTARAAVRAQQAAFATSLALALLLAIAGPWIAERVLLKVLPPRLPAARLRRSLLAVAVIVVNMVLIGTAVQTAWGALRLGGPLSDALLALQQSSVRVSAYAAFVITLGHMMLSRRRSSWRLLPLSDAQAERLAPFPWWIALLSAGGALVAEVNAVASASVAIEALTLTVFSLLVAVSVSTALRHARARDARSPDTSDTPGAPDGTPARPLWLGLLLACAAVAVVAILVAAALGFVVLSGLVARQMVWSGVVFATVYLLCMLADDLSDALLSSKGRLGGHVHTALGVDERVLDQTAVLASGAIRLVLFFYMAIALMAPLGTGPDEVFRRGSNVDHSLKIGELTLAPAALLTALAVACAGFAAIRVIQRWLSARYFPHTSLEPGMRSSIVTLLGYLGGVLVVAVALAGLGISVERIAWVASALSVGIGFGLQAIVQNFISGLILLAERPVKVGDWVRLGDTEGDVRRVNVRATEIQLGDRSTVIVPNSEFITKSVRNMTVTNAPGRVLLHLPAPLDTDARRMRELILQCFAEHGGMLDTPAPSVTLDGIQNGTLTFVAVGYVANPRNAGGARSDLLFAILERLKQAGLRLSPPATTAVPMAQAAEPPAANSEVAAPSPPQV